MRRNILVLSLISGMLVFGLFLACGGGGGGSVKWFHPTGIDDFISFDVSSVEAARVVMNSSGDAILVWGQSDTNFGSTINFTRVYMSERDGASGTWTHPADVNDYISPDGLSCSFGFCWPNAAIDDDGNAIVAWPQTSLAGTSWIFISERDGAMGIWTHPADSTDYLTEAPGSPVPTVAIGGGGDAIVAWSETATSSTSLVYFTQRTGVAGTWSTPEDVFVDVPPLSVLTSVSGAAIDDSGNAILVWVESSFGFTDTTPGWIFVSERDGASDLWTHPTAVDNSIAVSGSVGDSSPSNPRLALAGNGEAVISWFENDGTNFQVYAAEREAVTGSWIYPAGPTDKLSPSGSTAHFNRSAVNSGGEAVVVWRQFNGGGTYQIFRSERDGTGVWDNPLDLEDNISPDGFPAEEREVDIDDDGHTVIAWKQNVSASGTEAMFLSERTGSGKPWADPVDIDDFISPVGGREVRPPYVAVGGDGNALISWLQGDGITFRLYMSEKK